jgi:hypothetical protein
MRLNGTRCMNDSGFGSRQRVIRATVFDDDGDTKVVISPLEYSVQGGGQKTKQLSNYNDGYGSKVWCAAKALSDSLTSAAERLRARQADKVVGPPTPRDSASTSTE